MRRMWLAVTGTALLVGGVIAAGPAMAGLNELGSTTTAGAASAPHAKPAAVDRKTPAGAKQFMQVQSGRVRGGVVTLKVRPAKKVILGESFETEPIPGPFSEVTLEPNARILMLDGESGAPETFVDILAKRSADQRVEAFDITFDEEGEVSLVEWLYVP